MNVLLVDDDIEMLESMRRMVVNAGEGWEIAGVAEDGVEALALLREKQPDILVTDITMVQMDGLELIEKAKAGHPELHSILITCHEDFSYAKEGIELGVEDYLVKYTLTEPGFHKALERAREKIEKRREQRDSLRHLSAEVYKNREHFRENLIRTVLHAPAADIAALVARAPLYGIDLPPDRFTITGVYVSGIPAKRRVPDVPLLCYAVMNIASELIDFCRCFTFRYGEHVVLLLWGTQEKPEWRGRLKRRLRELRNYFSANFKVSLHAVCGCREITFAGLGRELEHLDGLRDCYFYGDAAVLEEDPQRTAPKEEPVPPQKLAALREHLFDIPHMKRLLERQCAELCAARYDPAQVRRFFDEVITELQFVAQYTGRWMPREPVSGDSLEECCGQVFACLDHLEESCFWRPGKRPGKEILQVAEHVNANLKEDLSLESVAALAHKSSGYLSRQFKKETGLSFSEFLIRQRVRKATYLLEHTDLPVERISEEVGIGNSRYFFTFFKRETGLSPGDLRRQKSGG